VLKSGFKVEDRIISSSECIKNAVRVQSWLELHAEPNIALTYADWHYNHRLAFYKHLSSGYIKANWLKDSLYHKSYAIYERVAVFAK
jgi:hypothetical protein